MEAYGQFAWKLRHYRRGPPESNHSSNGPVCRHLGERERDPSEHPTPLSLSRFFSFLSRSASLPRALAPPIPAFDSDSRLLEETFRSFFLSFSYSSQMFRLRRGGITAGSLRVLSVPAGPTAQDLAAARLIGINDRHGHIADRQN